MEKGYFVKDIVPQKFIEGIFIIRSAANAIAKNNNPYWNLTLEDVSGEISAKIWSPLSKKFSTIKTPGLAAVAGYCEEYNGVPQLKISNLAFLSDDEQKTLPPDWFMRNTTQDTDTAYAELLEICASEFVYPPWRRLILSILEDKEIGSLFKEKPAAAKIHHAYKGGLLEHTLGVCRLCRHFADQYSELDRQTLLAGAILHDIGKIREYTSDTVIDDTQEGRLLGHIFLGFEIIAPFLAKSGLDKPLQEHLKHLILSHHGQLEFGAAKLPQTAEAMALHYADNLDAKLAQLGELCAKSKSEWSERSYLLERRIWLATKTPVEFDANMPDEPDSQPDDLEAWSRQAMPVIYWESDMLEVSTAEAQSENEI